MGDLEKAKLIDISDEEAGINHEEELTSEDRLKNWVKRNKMRSQDQLKRKKTTKKRSPGKKSVINEY